MYPFIRMAKELWKFRKAPPLTILEPHISTHRIWPQDLEHLAEQQRNQFQMRGQRLKLGRGKRGQKMVLIWAMSLHG